MATPICPHCGRDEDVFINVRVSGWQQFQYGKETPESTSFGKVSSTLDQVKYSNTKLVRCAGCGKRRRDLVFDEANARVIVKSHL